MDSLLNQTFNSFEIILINDHSTDNSRSIVEEYNDQRIRIIDNKKNLGLVKSLNIGINKSRTKYILRVDSDDYVDKDFIKILYEKISEESFYAVSCNYYKFNKKSKILCNSKIQPIGCGIIFDKSKLFEINLYDEFFNYAEEEDLRKRFTKKYNIYNVNLGLYFYRMHHQNRSKDFDLVNKYRKMIK